MHLPKRNIAELKATQTPLKTTSTKPARFYEKHSLTKSSSDIVFCFFIFGARKYLGCLVEFNHSTQVHIRGEVGQPSSLLHVVSHDCHGVVRFQFGDKVFDFCR